MWLASEVVSLSGWLQRGPILRCLRIVAQPSNLHDPAAADWDVVWMVEELIQTFRLALANKYVFTYEAEWEERC